MIEFAPARPEDFAAFYPDGFPHTARAWSARIDGQPVGLGGVAYRAEGPYLFSNVTAELKQHPRAMVRAARAFLAEQPRPVVAFADPDIPNSVRFLTLLGLAFLGVQPNGFATFIWQGRAV